MKSTLYPIRNAIDPAEGLSLREPITSIDYKANKMDLKMSIEAQIYYKYWCAYLAYLYISQSETASPFVWYTCNWFRRTRAHLKLCALKREAIEVKTSNIVSLMNEGKTYLKFGMVSYFWPSSTKSIFLRSLGTVYLLYSTIAPVDASSPAILPHSGSPTKSLPWLWR